MDIAGSIGSRPAGRCGLCGGTVALGPYRSRSLPIADKARAVIVWSVDPNDADYPQRPGADLDVYWLDNQGNEITNSESSDNNFEVVGVYDVRPAGTRTLRIHAYRLPPRPVRMAYAVHWWDN